jgi:hypothetical protein
MLLTGIAAGIAAAQLGGQVPMPMRTGYLSTSDEPEDRSVLAARIGLGLDIGGAALVAAGTALIAWERVASQSEPRRAWIAPAGRGIGLAIGGTF